MNRSVLVFLVLLLFTQNCLYEKGYIRRVQLYPNGEIPAEKVEIPQPNRVQFRKCMYSFVALFWYNRPFPVSWNDIIADPSTDEKHSMRLKNAVIYIDGIDFFPPWTVFMLFLPFPTVPIMRTCGVVEGEVTGTSARTF
ncbi:hypothetical protein EHO61_00655 [Leptospira fluminis]|uniref:Uncharacterized protein n=1 Tax=Leptospira fluminis TaxID=2484979 RepID=A0A4R9GTP7_9LEPT|nr:hypothetical protein [Leptospira fluminis]TGK22324.1 hypothetical protein EHO61_00655 [Leptospira fluminis]